MAVEIERKFLLKNDHWRNEPATYCDYMQGYLTKSEGKCSIRVRTSSDKAWLNIKSSVLGMERMEFEYEIPYKDAQEIIKSLCFEPVIKKRRYYIPYGKHTWEIDVFEGENAGLVIAEIELASVDEPFERPDWVGREVTDDRRYYNVSLLTHPYSKWNND